MIAVDTNLLVYAHLERLDRHHQARAAIARLIARGKPWAIPWPCVHEFLAVVSNRKFHLDAPGTRELLAVVDRWHQAPGLRFIGIGDEHWTHLRRLLERSDVHGGQVHDARIAAVCEEAGVTELWTADRDFSRFPGLRVHNPL
ncbi:MAG: type II toxin-antitoxin system VapC family toxin [Xanthomonadales bacterium]|nr:type II toxin-antitoxin system VapC family toxin [Xanthomonadales bacterium]